MKTLAEVKGDEDNIETPLRIKWLEEDEVFKFEKISKRQGNVKPILCAALKMKIADSKVKACKLCIEDPTGKETDTSLIESNMIGSFLDDTLIKSILKNLGSGAS